MILRDYQCLTCGYEAEACSEPTCPDCNKEMVKVPGFGGFKVNGYNAANGYADKKKGDK